MTEKYIVQKRSNLPLAVIEILFSAAFLSYWVYKNYKLDWILIALIFLGSTMSMGFLFFRVRIFRYLFAILFSLFWGFLGYAFANSVTKSAITPLILMSVFIIISLLLHKSYFEFQNHARRIDYRD